MKKAQKKLVVGCVWLLLIMSCTFNNSSSALAKQNFEKGKYSVSLDMLNHIAGKRKLSFGEFFLRGRCYAKLQKYNLAIWDYKNCESQKRNDSIVLKNIGECYLIENQLDSAKIYFNRIIEIQPKNGEVLNLRGLCYLRQKNIDSAIFDFNASIKIHPNYLAYNNLGLANEEKGNYKQAIGYYALSIQKNQTDDKVFFNKGVSHTYLKQLDSAMINYNRAIELNPNNPTYFVNRGMVNYLLKSFASACQDWQQARKMNNSQADTLILQYCR